MANGEAGKTYFWNHKIKPKIEAMQVNGKKTDANIYVFIWNIKPRRDKQKKIFIETTQLMDKNLKKIYGSKWCRKYTRICKNRTRYGKLFGVTQNGDRLDYAQFFSTDDKVLCFDDLERANVDVIDILGYINNFVEHDHIKTIIICNEKLSTKLKNSNLEMKNIYSHILIRQRK